MRVLLLFNPEATSVSPRVRDVIAHALSSEVKLDVAETKRRHHATHLARGAAHEGYDAVAVLGGDGTANEVINGLAGTEVAVIPIPGGGTNVFARTLGLPRDPVDATSVLLERLRSGAPPRRISLGRINGRMFAFCAGVGFDACVVDAVERRSRLKKKMGEPYFIYQALRLWAFGPPRARRTMRVRIGEHLVERARVSVVCNSDPYTFLGSRPFRLCPDATYAAGLDATVLKRLRPLGIARLLPRAFGDGSHTKMRFIEAFHDLDSLTIEADDPLPYQVDGDFAGEARAFEFRSLPHALSVIA